MSQLTDTQLRDFLVNDTNDVINEMYDSLVQMGVTSHASASDWCDSLVGGVTSDPDYSQMTDSAAKRAAAAAVLDSFSKNFTDFIRNI